MARLLADVLAQYDRAIALNDKQLLRELVLADLFALLVIGCRRSDMRHQWVLDRCDEVFKAPNGHLDLWARGHYKSSLITFGLTLQNILADREVTIGIFSHTRPIAKGFFRQIKRELESNPLLIDLFPDVLWATPRKEAPKWSEDDGIIVKRSGNPKEATLEAWGLVDGQPIGKHFKGRVYDDVVTPENASSPDMREKTLRALEMSYNLGVSGGWQRFIGTRYHYADAYKELMERGTVTARVHPAIDAAGVPVFMSQAELDEKRRDYGPFTFASQMMLDPRQEGSVKFLPSWWRTYTGTVTGNTYIIVDPANAKKKKSDYTALWVVTAGEDGNFYIRHLTRDRLNLSERIELVIRMHREHKPRKTIYEQYGMQADIEAIKIEQERQGYRFDITPVGGTTAKYDRIMTLMPMFEQGRIWFPPSILEATKDAGLVDQVVTFRGQEYDAWPYAAHDDCLDGLARVNDPDAEIVWPKPADRARAAYRRNRQPGFVV
jgi:predicted phage terminase large subunit-like protein